MSASQGRRAKLRREVVDAQRALLDVLVRVGENGWTRSSPNEGWTARDLLLHLATTEAGFAKNVQRMLRGEGGVPADFDQDRWNASQLRRNADATVDDLQRLLISAHAELLGVIDGADDGALDQRGYLTTGEEGSVEDTLRLVARHKRTHTHDIEAALA